MLSELPLTEAALQRQRRHAASRDGVQTGGGHFTCTLVKMKVIAGFHEAALKTTAEFTGDQEIGTPSATT